MLNSIRNSSYKRKVAFGKIVTEEEIPYSFLADKVRNLYFATIMKHLF